MNVKLWVGVVTVMVILSSTGLYMYNQDSEEDRPADSKSMYLISRVNTEGSGIFAKVDGLVPRNADGTLRTNPDGTVNFGDELSMYQARWNGLRMGTPGASSIQHMMLMDFVKNQLKMNFATVEGDNTVIWMSPLTNVMSSIKEYFRAGDIDGGIVWETNYQDVLLNYGGKPVLLTAELSPNHACCVIAANKEYALNHSGDTIRFLAAYLKAVTWMNHAIDNPGSNDYNQLVEIAARFTYPNDWQDPTNQEVVKNSLLTVKYRSEIGNLREEIVNIVNTYSDLRLLSNSVKDLGFSNAEEFADWLITDSYLELAKDAVPEIYERTTTIRVAMLALDIHQLAMEVGMKKGYFTEYGINISIQMVLTGGGGVANLIITGQTDIGFLGAPPVVSTTINSGR